MSGSAPQQVSLRRLREFGVKPKRDLGQNFLIDDNILGLILGALEADSNDVALEVGAGLGVLTQALAGVVSVVHAFEIDHSLEKPLAVTIGGCDNIHIYFEDILAAPLEQLQPAPTLCASNLPYSVAGPFLIEALKRLPSIRRYCVMVQKEVANRITASPGGKDYGVLSIWVQLYARPVSSRALSRAIFYPAPHVDSTLLVLDRLAVDELPNCSLPLLERVVQAAFGQRRKTLRNALEAGLGIDRQITAELLQAFGLPGDTRGERLTPGQFVELTRQLAVRADLEAEGKDTKGEEPCTSL